MGGCKSVLFQYYIMSIICKQQVCINLSSLRVFGDLSYGKYSLEIKLFQQYPTYRKLSLPISVIPLVNNQQNQPKLTNKSYNSSYFRLVPKLDKDLKQIIFFQHQFEILSIGTKLWDYKIELNLQANLFHYDYDPPQLKATYNGKIKGSSVNQSLIIDFWQFNTPCQFIGTIHACVFKFYYAPNHNFKGNFDDFCRSHSKESVQQLLKILLKKIDESNSQFEKFTQSIQKKTRHQQLNRPSRQSLKHYMQEKRQSYSRKVSEQPRLPSFLRDLQEKDRQEKQQRKKGFAGFRPQNTNKKKVSKPKQRHYSLKKFINSQSNRIFISPQKRKQDNYVNNITIQEFQKILNTSCGLFYEKWTKVLTDLLIKQINVPLNSHDQGLIKNLVRKVSGKEKDHHISSCQKMINNLRQQYNKNLKNILYQYIIFLDGDWQRDLYAEQLAYRNRIAMQKRKYIYSLLENKQKLNMAFYSQRLINQYNPIFFQQKIYRVNRHLYTFIDKFQSIASNQQQQKQFKKIHLIICVHGLGGSRFDMAMLKGQIKRYFFDKKQSFKVYSSLANQNKTDNDIRVMATRFASEVRQQITKVGEQNIEKLSFIGHSLGGIIIRSALPALQNFWPLFYSFVSFSSPHLGFSAPSSKLIDAGIWLMNNWNKTQSITQLSIADNQNKYESFLYKLSMTPGIQKFKKISFFSSQQDMLVPYYSSRVQKYEKNSKIRIRISQSKDKIKAKISEKYHQHLHRNNSNNPFTLIERPSTVEQIDEERAKVNENEIHNKMCQNIIGRIRDRESRCQIFRRIQVNFGITNQNIDNLIGRAAHLAYINNFEFLRIFLNSDQDYIF